MAGNELDSVDVGRSRVQRQMHLASLTTTLCAMLARLLFGIIEELDPAAVDQQVERPIGTPIRTLHREGILLPIQDGQARNRTIQLCQLQ